jgi:hypothetical protein
MTWWMGRQLEGGRPPLMDPEQGQAGNLVADMQYGALDPLHWGLQALAARTDDALVMAWGFATICVLLLGTGVLTLLRQHGVHRVLAVAGALGAASSGFYLWYGSAWWPLLWSVAWLPWFWWGLVSRRTPGIVVLGLATWALLASGNPYILFFALALVLAQLVELVRDHTLRVLVTVPVTARLLAMLAGLAAALPTLLSTVEMSPYISRQEADLLVGNVGFGVTNLVDVLLGSPTLMGQTNAWSGNLGLVPAMYTLTAAVAAVALVDWKRAVRSPGVLTALVLFCTAVVFTQLPTTVSVFRYPIRYLVVVQVGLAVLALLAVTAAPLLTRRRLLLAVGLVGAQAVLAEFRAPVFYRWHLLSMVVTLVALAALVVLVGGLRARASRPGRLPVLGAATAVLLLVSWGTVFIGERMMVSLADRMDVINEVPDQGDMPHRALYPGEQLGTAVAAYRDRSVLVDGSATVIAYDFGADSGWSTGVLRGNGNLMADFRSGSGSFAVWQGALNTHWCRTYAGSTCGDPQWLLDTAPGTGVAWLDLLSEDDVLLADGAPEPIRQHLDATWTRGADVGGYTAYTREDGLPGRVTVARGVDVTEGPGGIGLGRGDGPMDSYTVSTGAEAGELAFRTTWWPGMQATLDGRPITVGTVDGAVLRLDLPAGLDGASLEISYVPIGERILLPAFVVAGLLLVASLVVSVLTGRRGARGAASRRGRARDEVPA